MTATVIRLCLECGSTGQRTIPCPPDDPDRNTPACRVFGPLHHDPGERCDHCRWAVKTVGCRRCGVELCVGD